MKWQTLCAEGPVEPEEDERFQKGLNITEWILVLFKPAT